MSAKSIVSLAAIDHPRFRARSNLSAPIAFGRLARSRS
jgi:hypothetical protein